jgi:WD40 repeat protein
VWKLDQAILGAESVAAQKKGAPTKRVKTSQVSNIGPAAKIHCAGGISSLKWASPNQIAAGCRDHTIKLVNVERQQVEEVIFTSHKVPTSLDSTKGSLLLTGHEDSVIRLWDVRTGASERNAKAEYEAHSQWVSTV